MSYGSYDIRNNTLETWCEKYIKKTKKTRTITTIIVIIMVPKQVSVNPSATQQHYGS